ncbi:hypothetical protein DPMN_118149 [Dreissena polymorpha]|uniref:Uncharacterized protein n=1 Tax=Dreissena polymorpha TaxID=45954 RepID=A0A9D4GFX1_DREPO|nr:hypothetical protein DPMN_118149 [Dreissena polymorpha]
MASLRLFAGEKANNHSTTFRHSARDCGSLPGTKERVMGFRGLSLSSADAATDKVALSRNYFKQQTIENDRNQYLECSHTGDQTSDLQIIRWTPHPLHISDL